MHVQRHFAKNLIYFYKNKTNLMQKFERALNCVKFKTIKVRKQFETNLVTFLN